MVWYIMFALFVVIIAVMAFVNWINTDTSADTMIDEPFEDPVPKVYGKKYTSDGLCVYHIDGHSAEQLWVHYNDRFVRVNQHVYMKIYCPHSAGDVYVIPDRLMSERR